MQWDVDNDVTGIFLIQWVCLELCLFISVGRDISVGGSIGAFAGLYCMHYFT